jgi:uncharacterized protein (DUF433 family)
MQAMELGKYIVADPEVCHGKPTFRGTRIFVRDVLEMVAQGTDWDLIIKEWRGNITREAIAEAILIASEVLETRVSQPEPEPELVNQ